MAIKLPKIDLGKEIKNYTQALGLGSSSKEVPPAQSSLSKAAGLQNSRNQATLDRQNMENRARAMAQSDADTYNLNGNVYRTTPSGVGYPVNGQGAPDTVPAQQPYVDYRQRTGTTMRPFPAAEQPYVDYNQRRPDAAQRPFPQQEQPYQDYWMRRPDTQTRPFPTEQPTQGYQDYYQRRPDAAQRPFPQQGQNPLQMLQNGAAQFGREVINAPQNIIHNATGVNTGTPAADQLESVINELLGKTQKGVSGGLVPNFAQDPRMQSVIQQLQGQQQAIPVTQGGEAQQRVPNNFGVYTEPGLGSIGGSFTPGLGLPQVGGTIGIDNGQPFGSANVNGNIIGQFGPQSDGSDPDYQMFLRQTGLPDSAESRIRFQNGLGPNDPLPQEMPDMNPGAYVQPLYENGKQVPNYGPAFQKGYQNYQNYYGVPSTPGNLLHYDSEVPPYVALPNTRQI